MPTTELERLISVEHEVRALKESLAPRIWVQEELHKQGKAIDGLADNLTQLAAQVTNLFAAHENFLQEESARKQEIHNAELEALKAKTFGAYVRNQIVPWAVAITALFVAWNYISPVIRGFLNGP